MRVAAAGAAAGGVFALGDLEARTAAAGGDDVRVFDLEPGLLQRLEEIDRRPLQVWRAELIDNDPHAVELELEIARLGATVEAKLANPALKVEIMIQAAK